MRILALEASTTSAKAMLTTIQRAERMKEDKSIWENV